MITLNVKPFNNTELPFKWILGFGALKLKLKRFTPHGV